MTPSRDPIPPIPKRNPPPNNNPKDSPPEKNPNKCGITDLSIQMIKSPTEIKMTKIAKEDTETSTNFSSGAWSSALFSSFSFCSRRAPKRMAAEKWEDSDKKPCKEQEWTQLNNKWVTTWLNPPQSSSMPAKINSKNNKIWKRKLLKLKGNWQSLKLCNRSHFNKNSTERRWRRNREELKLWMLRGSRHLSRQEDNRTIGTWVTVRCFMVSNREHRFRCNHNSHSKWRELNQSDSDQNLLRQRVRRGEWCQREWTTGTGFQLVSQSDRTTTIRALLQSTQKYDKVMIWLALILINFLWAFCVN